MNDLPKSIVLVPFQRHIEPECDEALRALADAGVPVRRRGGRSAIDFARSDMVSQALIEGYESILFIDSDIAFEVPDALRILARPEPVVAGLYGQKEFNRKVNALFDPSRSEIPCGAMGADIPVRGVGAGFLRIRREALLRLIESQRLPECTRHGGRVWPFFLPQVEQAPDLGWEYLGEDYAFCRRCERAGIPVLVDTTILLVHVGTYWYTLEDAMRGPPQLRASFVMPHRSGP